MNNIKRNISFEVFVLLILVIASPLQAQDQKREEKFRLGMNYEQNSEFEKARDIFLELYKSNTGDFNSFSSLNRIYIKLKEYDSSEKIINGKLKASPADYNLYGLLGNTYYAKGEIENAYKIWEQGLAIMPKSIVPYRTMANYAIQNKAYDKAIEYYLLGESNLGKRGIFLNEIFNLYSVQFKFDEAANLLCEALLTQPEYIGIGKSIISAYISRSDVPDKFMEAAKKYLAESGKTVFKELMAFIYQVRGESEKAFGLIREIEEANKTSNNLIFNFAHECFANRNYHASSMAFKYIIDNYPKGPLSTQARIYYPQALELMLAAKRNKNSNWKMYSFPDTSESREYYGVIKIYKENVKLFPKTDIQNESLLRMGIIQKEILLQNDSAELSFNQIIKNNIYTPSLITAYEKLAEIKLFENNFSGAEELCNKIIRISATDSLSKRRAHFLLGKSYYWQGDYNKALDNFNDITYDFSNDLSNDAIEISAIINSSKKDSVLLLEYAKADYLIFQRNFSGALELLQKTAQSENSLLGDAAKYRWAMVQIALNRYPEALKILEEIYTPGNSNYADNAYFSSGNIYYYELNDFRSAKEKFEKLLEVFPGSILTDKAREMLNIIKNKSETDNDDKQNRH